MKKLFFILTMTFFIQVGLPEDLKVGIIGLDTSHVTAFTEILNNPQSKNHVPGAKVVGAFKGGSDDLKVSYSRVENFNVVS